LAPAVIATAAAAAAALPLRLAAPFSVGATLAEELVLGAAAYVVALCVVAPEQLRQAWALFRARG
jgi:hypothetical protein